MKKWMCKIVVFVGLILTNMVPVLAQNTLGTLGLTSSTPAAAAYSLRKLSSSYSGPLVRIFNGLKYYDIYPDGTSGWIASTSLRSAAITNYDDPIAVATAAQNLTTITASATIAVWYDQSGNGRHVYQATTANQPDIWTGSALKLNGNSKPAVYFDGTSTFLQTTSAATWLSGTGYSLSAVVQTPGTTNANYFLGNLRNGSTASTGLHFGQRSNTQFTLAQFSNDADYTITQNTGTSLRTAIKYVGSGGSEAWLNGTNLGTNTKPDANLSISASTTIGLLNIGCGHQTTTSGFWLGYISEILIFDIELSDAERQIVEANQATAFGVTVPNAPTISAQPSTTAQSVCLNGTPTNLSVTASVNSGTIAYQWYSNASASNTTGTLISGATSSSHTPITTGAGTTYYYCILTNNSSGYTTTSNVSGAVTVRTAFTTGAISTTGQTICSGGTPTVIGSATASSGGNGTITYSWRSSADSYASAISGATSATYTPPAGLTSTTSYKRYANDGTCTTTPTVSTGTWTVTVRSVFTSGAINTTGQTICSGGTPTVIGSSTASSGGDGTITYSWRSSSDSYASAISGATSATYTPPAGLTSTTSYRRYANDGTCTTTPTVSTGTWTVTVRSAFTSGAISTTGQTICSGGTRTVIGSSTAASGGDASITYSWRSSADSYASAISGATSETYTPPAGLTSTTSYRRYANDGTCTTTPTVSTGTWTVTVNALPTPTFTAQPGATANASTDVTYTTESGQSNYIWTVPGTLNTDYTITSGGVGTSSNTVTLKWLTGGSKTVTINYTNSNNCTASTATSSTATTVTQTSAPTSVTGTTTICAGSSATLTASGGDLVSPSVNVWYRGGYGGDAYDNGWDVTTAISSSSGQSTTNNNANGILNLTSTGDDPYFYMSSLGSFNPSTYRYINVRYRVTAGTGGNMQVFFLNTTYTGANGSATATSATLNSDGNWHTISIDMSSSAAWTTGGNITGWRFDWSNNSGVTMDIDFIQLGTGEILDDESSITVSPATNTTYYVNRKGPSVNTSSISQLVTVRSAFTSGAINTTGQTICSGGTPTVIGSSTAASGGDASITYSWRSSADSYASAISGATSETYTPPAGLTSTTSYRRYAKDGTCSTTPTVSTGTWTVTVNQPSTAAVLSGTATITLGNSTNLSVAITGGTSPYTVVYSNGTSNTTVNSYTSGSNISVSPTTTTTYTLVSVTGANGCAGSGNSGSAVITVNAGPTASVLSGTTTICSGSSTNLSVAITGGTSPFTVVYSNGTSNTTVSSYTSGANISVSPTATTTYTLVSVTDANSNVGTGNSGSAVISVTSPSVAGTISGGGVSVVSGSNSTTLTLSGYTGSIQWQSSTTSSSSGFADIVGATSATYTATNLSATTYYQAVVTNGVCSSATASSVTISMLASPSISYAGASGSMQFVRNSAITSLTITNVGGEVSGVYRQVSDFAGSGTASFNDGTGTSATFNGVRQIAINSSGDLFVADASNNRIRKITASGVVTTFAGSGTATSTDGQGTAATFNNPNGIAINAQGDIFVADKVGNKIRKITATGAVSTFAGTGASGSSDNATGTSATFNNPWGLCFDASGNLFVADGGSGKVRKITPAGAVSTYGASQVYSAVRGMAFDNSGNLYVTCDHIIYKITPSETASVFVGGVYGDVDGNGASARIGSSGYMQLGSDNYIYFTDVDMGKIKKMSVSADVTTIVGGAILDGNGNSTALVNPYGFVFDGLGNAFITSWNGNKIKKISFLGYSISPSLPTGLSFSNTNGTISGTPTTTTAATTYTITAANAAGSNSTTVTFATGPLNTITRTSAAGTVAQTVCANTAITNITYTTTSATGATFSGLPTGVSGAWASNVVTISGTPTVAGSYSYTVTLTGGIGTVTATGTITVSETPVIASQSTATQTVCQNATAASFSVTATGTGTISYQWYSNTSASTSSATNLGSANGAQTATYTPQTTATGTKYYYCVVTIGSCTATSAFSGAVVVTPLSVAGSISGAGGTCYGTAKTLTLSGNTGTIQWQVSTTSSSSGFADISGETASTYVVPTTTATGTYYYQAVVTNGVCSPATTSSVTVNVNDLPVVTASPSTVGQTICQYLNATTLSVSATGTSLTYQWYSNTTASNSGGTSLGTATGAQTATYTPLTSVAGTTYYYCVVTNSNSCTATSAVSGAIIVNAVPVVAGVAQAGQFGNGLKFAGSYVLSAVSGTSLTNFTLESYIKFNTNQISGILQWANTLGSAGPFVYWKQDGLNLVMYVYADYRITTTLSLDTWYHVALVYNGTVYTLYINGSPVGTYTGPLNAYNFQNSATGLYLGNGYHGYYSGSMDEVRVWNTARTQSEIQSSLNTELSGTETGLMAYYNFNQGTAGGTNTGLTTLTDRTSNANNGTLNGFALTGSTSNWVAGAQSTGGSSTAGAVCVNSTIQLSNTTTGGTWSTSDATIATVDNTGLVTGVAAGSVTISYTVTNASNCSTTATSTVTVNALPVISSQSTAAQRVIQNGIASAFSVTATGTSLTYLWYSNTTASNTGGTSIASATSSSYTPPTATLGTTYYYCIVTNASGCIATSAVSGAVVIEQMYITSIGTIGTVCYSSTAQTSTLAYTATANNPNSYSIDWNAAANTAGLADQTSTSYSFVAGGGTIPDIAISAGATAGTYSGTLTIRNTNNITATLAVTITINPLPTITTTGIATAKCISTSAQTTSLVYTATTQSPISYSIDWNAAANTAGLADQSSTSYTFVAGGGTLSSIAIPANIAGGTYSGTMTITNANGCTNTQAISYTSFALPIAGIRNNTSTTVLTSTVTSISLTATGGSGYIWVDGASALVSTTAAYRVTAPGTYTVTVTNTNGCSSTASITITQTSTPPATAITNNTGTTELNCTTTSISLTATGGGTYSWSNGTSVVGTSAGLTVTTPGTYTVTVTNGGTTTSSITITQNVVTSATAVLTGSTTITNGKSANLQATISIGNAPYTVVISDGTSQFTTYSYYSGPNIIVSPSATSTYTLVSVTGANGCSVTSTSGSATVTINSGGTAKVWTGAAGDDLWSTDGNWSPSGTPASNDFITIPSGTPQLDVYFTVNGSLTVNGTGTLTVNAGKSIDIGPEGVVDFGKRDITFKSSATGTAQLGKIEGTLNNADSLIVERYFPAGRRAYRFISASVTTPSSIRYNWMENATPVYTYTTIYTTLSAYNPKLAYGTHITGTGGNTNGFDRTALNTSTLYTLNTTTQAWVGVGSTAGTLAAGDAYRILIRGDRAINLNNNNTYANATTIRTKGAPKVGMHTVSSSLSTIADGWSLVGNPYQSLVDLRAVSTTNLTPYYSVWDPQRGTRGAYVSYHLGTGIKSNIASDINELVQPGQAFFVQTLNAGAATLTFEESNKAPLGTQTRVFRPIANYPVLNVALNYTDSLANGAPEMDAFAVVFDNSFSNSVDKEDGPKNYNQDDNMGITRDGKLLAMELRDMYNSSTVIPMNMVNYVRTDYTLRINWSNPIDAGYEAYLKDNYTGATQTISFSSNTDYVFTVNSSIAASKATDRFSILFLPTSALPVSGLVLNGAAEGKQVKLQFDALNEREMAGYTIERSANGVDFEQIGEQAAVNGNVASRSYAFIDNKPITGNNYYRIKGTSMNGQVQYSNIKVIKLGNSMPTVLVAPNPANNDKLQLKVSQLLKGSYTVTVTDALGRVFCQKELVYDGVSGMMELKFPTVAKSGSYYVQVNGEGGSFTEAFIIR